MAIRKKALGPEHPDVAQSRNNLGVVLQARGKYAEAEVEYRGALGLWEKTTPELAHLKTTYAESFSEAFAVAIQELDVEDRVLLRQRLIDHLSIDDLAPLYGAHRATVARRITRARARLVARSKEIMSERLGLGPGTLDSIVRMIRSQLDISIVRRLREGSDSSPG